MVVSTVLRAATRVQGMKKMKEGHGELSCGTERVQFKPKVLKRTVCVVCSLGFLWGSTHYSIQTKGQVATDVLLLNFHKTTSCVISRSFLRWPSQTEVFLCKQLLFFLCLSGLISILTPSLFSVSVSNGSRDQPEPGPHALCHGLRFLWQPTNQRHVLCVLQGTPDTTAEQRPHEPPQPNGYDGNNILHPLVFH